MIALSGELSDPVCSEKLTSGAARIGLVGHSPRAIFAKFGHAPVFRIRPRATRAIEPFGLVHT